MKKRNRIISFFITILIALQSTPTIPIFAETSAAASGSFNIGGASVTHKQSLTDNQDGTYTLDIEFTSTHRLEDSNVNRHISKNGYFKAERDGDYLIELWGGKGADGLATNYGEGGKGGSGGHIYGTVYLNKGDILYYAAGGNGEQTLSTDEGGGANGNGGNHGDTGSYTVGGGGGYSAVYKFTENEFTPYINADGSVSEISENDRVKKYIMIAGGGGGGGAGNGFSFSSQTGRSDGGAGGSIRDLSGVLTGSGYDVSGTFFAGKNGKSSGSSAEYIGHGGTNLPGVIADTLLTLFKGKEPNDWRGTYNSTEPGGSGGSGNLRGGAGGAGFCGGSGGVMTGLLSATNVGGGGGGSSFVADTVNTDLSDYAKELLLGDNFSETGGSIAITYLVEDDFSFLENLNFTITASKYFVFSGKSTCEGGEISDRWRNYITITNASVIPDSENSSQAPLRVSLNLTPRDGFAGGNNVPLFAENGFVCKAEGKEDTVVTPGDECSHANVPLNFPVNPRSYTTNVPNTPCPVTNFYTDKYEKIRNNLSSDSGYDFIESITEYRVTDSNGTQVSGSVAHAETTPYDVSFIVTPKGGAVAAVGTPVSETVFSGKAFYRVVSSGAGELNGHTLSYSKDLSFDKETGLYRLNLSVDSSTGNDINYFEDITYKSGELEQGFYEHEILYDGYYLLQAWGGNGGDGHYYLLVNDKASNGGSGGYVDGFIHLEPSDRIRIDVIGADGDDGNTGLSNFAAGRGGGFTKFSVKKSGSSDYQPVLIAGGGGGGGRGRLFNNPQDGKSGVTEGTDPSEAPATDSSYKGTDGGTGNNGLTDGEGGPAGPNFKSTVMDKELEEHELLDYARQKIEAANYSQYDYSAAGGAAYITCIQTDRIKKTESMQEGELSDYTLETEISKYFDFVKCDGKNNKSDTPLDISYKENNGCVTVDGINPFIEKKTEYNQDNVVITGSVSFTVSIFLKPKNGFLGGNDVPLLNSDGASGVTGMRLSQPQISENGSTVSEIPREDPADYANVAIPYSPTSEDLKTFERIYVQGDAGIPKSELYSWKNKPAPQEDWQADFVNIVMPEEETLTPEATTFYPIKVGIEPKAAPERAEVIPSAEAVTLEGEGAIYVETKIIYNIENLTTDDIPDKNGFYSAPTAVPYSAQLTATEGYELPEDVTVTDRDGNPLNHTFDSKTGKLVISAEGMTGIVTITAASVPRTYTLNFIYEESPGGAQQIKSYKLRAGDKLPSAGSVFNPPEIHGYKFVWDWGDGQTETPQSMPSRNLWVIGSYIPVDFTVTINFLYPGGELIETVTVTKPYGAEYQVTAPPVPGYLPETPVISGTVTKDEVIDIYYKPTENSLNIIYFIRDNPDSPAVYKKYSADIKTGEEYRIETVPLEGYTPDQTVIEGVMGAEGAIYYVYYDPNTYTVTFNAGGGVCDTESKSVVYHSLYGRNPDDSYSAMPEPVKVGYVFDGWYLGDELITETSKVNIPSDHELVAKWKKNTSSLTVKYLFEDGTQAAEDTVLRIAFDEAYSISSPEIKGYTADKLLVSGIMPANNTVIEVYYSANEYNLTVHYVYYESGGKAAEDFAGRYKYLEEYSVPSPEIAGYSYTLVLNGTMGAEDFETTVYYYATQPEVNVTISWGDLNYIYTHGEWDPQTHTYKQHPIAPESVGKNTVTVSNSSESKIPVNAVFGYIPAAGYESLSAYYTSGGAEDARLNQITAKPGEAATSYIWLEGTLPRSVKDPFSAGKCTVTLKGGK